MPSFTRGIVVASYRKKLCMLGAAGVGKTSLVERYVAGTFSDRYVATVGTKVDRTIITLGFDAVSVMLWDLPSADPAEETRLRYLQGAAGYLLVVDGTRAETLEHALRLHASAHATLGDVPFAVVLNKADLAPQWTVDGEAVDALAARGWAVHMTSAKGGEGVVEAFETLARQVIGAP
ncbi:MAG: GTP-binding protein [Gemmatimonadaceae bacterium]|nr:GTP-binding protein [Gemmatimonadaceae bacterium]